MKRRKRLGEPGLSYRAAALPVRPRGPAGVALGVAVVFGGASAAASETFPPVVAQVIGTPCVPGCQLCHGIAAPASPPADERISLPSLLKGTGWNVKARDAATLRASLMQVVAILDPTMDGATLSLPVDNDNDGMPNFMANMDVNMNGVGDFQDLRNDINPYLYSDYSGDLLCIPTPTYGCGATVAPEPDSGAWPRGLVIVGLLGLRLRAARRRRG